MTATLNIPYKGYTRINLIEKEQFKWKAEIIGSGLEIYIYEDEFTKD